MEGLTGEKALASDLYEYLHDQGVDFAVESASASGEPDLVSTTITPRLVADAKYIRLDDSPGEAHKTLASGFRQVFEYCRDYNEPVGYLIVYIARDLKIEVLGDRDDGFACLRLGGNTVYYVLIDIHQHAASASKRPTPQVVTLTREDVAAALGATDITSPST